MDDEKLIWFRLGNSAAHCVMGPWRTCPSTQTDPFHQPPACVAQQPHHLPANTG